MLASIAIMAIRPEVFLGEILKKGIA